LFKRALRKFIAASSSTVQTLFKRALRKFIGASSSTV
jgi:hypothetical protein